jgi:hypothetical protein
VFFCYTFAILCSFLSIFVFSFSLHTFPSLSLQQSSDVLWHRVYV